MLECIMTKAFLWSYVFVHYFFSLGNVFYQDNFFIIINVKKLTNGLSG